MRTEGSLGLLRGIVGLFLTLKEERTSETSANRTGVRFENDYGRLAEWSNAAGC